MDKKVLEAYNKLVPADQLVIDCMIASLFKKDEQLSAVVKDVQRLLQKEAEENAMTAMQRQGGKRKQK